MSQGKQRRGATPKPPRNPERKNKRDSNVVDMHDAAARKDGPAKKNWTRHDLIHFAPANDRQAEALQAYFQGNDVAMLGAAGAGKTILASYMAASSLVNHSEGINQIIIVRSAVQEREIGFTPGTEEEKLAMYEAPYVDSFAVVFDHPTSYRNLKEQDKVVFTSTTFKRGVNFRNAVVILEEVQNYTLNELKTLIGRVNDSCRLILTGDTDQCDLGFREVSGLPVFEQIHQDMHEMAVINFLPEDTQRGERVKKFFQALEKFNKRKEQAHVAHPGSVVQ